MLATSIQLHDVQCVESFVAATLRRSGIHFTADEHEDLIAEGLAILYQLADTWQPRLPGHDQDGRFSGYAAYMLPKRLTDAWHRGHREHSFAADPDTGRRKWKYGPPPASLDAPGAEQSDTSSLVCEETVSLELARIRRGIQQAAQATADDALRYSVLLAAGLKPAEARARLGVDEHRGRMLHVLVAWAAPFVSGATSYVPEAA